MGWIIHHGLGLGWIDIRAPYNSRWLICRVRMATKSRIKNVPGSGGMPAAFGGAGGHHHHHCRHHHQPHHQPLNDHDHPANIVTNRNSSNACSPQELRLRHHSRLHQSAQVIRSDAPMDVVMMMFIIMMLMTTTAKTMMMNCSLPRGPSVTYRPKWEQANQTTYHRYYPIPTTG